MPVKKGTGNRAGEKLYHSWYEEEKLHLAYCKLHSTYSWPPGYKDGGRTGRGRWGDGVGEATLRRLFRCSRWSSIFRIMNSRTSAFQA